MLTPPRLSFPAAAQAALAGAQRTAARVVAGDAAPAADGDEVQGGGVDTDTAGAADAVPEEAAWLPRVAVSVLMGLLLVLVLIGAGGSWAAARRRRRRRESVGMLGSDKAATAGAEGDPGVAVDAEDACGG